MAKTNRSIDWSCAFKSDRHKGVNNRHYDRLKAKYKSNPDMAWIVPDDDDKEYAQMNEERRKNREPLIPTKSEFYTKRQQKISKKIEENRKKMQKK